ncbi:hypothetical protein EVAR_67542_1 [Eumeta japonica]|uniref:Uncharacterized protein n=1 Tax=Eumeta variegata TaxID=151549 RepID=A0A4C2A0R9_EUMVA|nr:hypothetical protein EVAR_67542_1 [Eumeta japonica]
MIDSVLSTTYISKLVKKLSATAFTVDICWAVKPPDYFGGISWPHGVWRAPTFIVFCIVEAGSLVDLQTTYTPRTMTSEFKLGVVLPSKREVEKLNGVRRRRQHLVLQAYTGWRQHRPSLSRFSPLSPPQSC